MPSDKQPLPKILWLWIPLGAILIQLIGENFLYREHIGWVVGEHGPYELIQWAVILLSFFLACFVLLKMDKSNKWLVAWIGLAALCCFYVSGEEVSWGQHILKWNTPEYWAALNDQNETNLHNTSSWLDQKPRILLSIGVYIGGLIIPLLMKMKPALLPAKFNIIYPASALAVTAGVCVLIKLLDTYGDLVIGMSGTHILGRAAENEEMFLFYFVFLYLLLMKKRLIPAKS